MGTSSLSDLLAGLQSVTRWCCPCPGAGGCAGWGAPAAPYVHSTLTPSLSGEASSAGSGDASLFNSVLQRDTLSPLPQPTLPGTSAAVPSCSGVPGARWPPDCQGCRQTHGASPPRPTALRRALATTWNATNEPRNLDLELNSHSKIQSGNRLARAAEQVVLKSACGLGVLQGSGSLKRPALPVRCITHLPLVSSPGK